MNLNISGIEVLCFKVKLSIEPISLKTTEEKNIFIPLIFIQSFY